VPGPAPPPFSASYGGMKWKRPAASARTVDEYSSPMSNGGTVSAQAPAIAAQATKHPSGNHNETRPGRLTSQLPLRGGQVPASASVGLVRWPAVRIGVAERMKELPQVQPDTDPRGYHHPSGCSDPTS